MSYTLDFLDKKDLLLVISTGKVASFDETVAYATTVLAQAQKAIASGCY